MYLSMLRSRAERQDVMNTHFRLTGAGAASRRLPGPRRRLVATDKEAMVGLADCSELLVRRRGLLLGRSRLRRSCIGVSRPGRAS